VKDAHTTKSVVATESRYKEMWAATIPLDGTEGAAYVERRGIPLDVASEAGVRFSPNWYNSGRAAVTFPMYDKAGALVGVNGRYLLNGTPKTQTAGPKSLGLFTTPGALSASLIAVCEGPFDALALYLCGVPSIALVGVTWPEWLPRTLAFKAVLIATDADEAGDGAASRLAPELTPRGARIFRLRPKGANDWGEALEKRGFESLRASLAAFAETSDDEARVNAAWDLKCAQRDDAASFITSLIEDGFIRQTFADRMNGRSVQSYSDATNLNPTVSSEVETAVTSNAEKSYPFIHSSGLVEYAPGKFF
jgi:DNA primase